MEDIRFYDFEGRTVAIVHDVISAVWRLCYNDIGNFEVHFSPCVPYAAALTEEPWLVAVQGSMQAIITARRIGRELVLYGKTPNWLLEKRVVEPFVTADVSGSGAVHPTIPQIVDWVIDRSFDEDDPLSSAAPQGAISQTPISFWRNTANTAFEVIRDCADRDECGHRVTFSPQSGSWEFQLYKGTARDVILSEAGKTASETEYTEDLSELANGGWYGRELISKGNYDPVTNTPTLHNDRAENFGHYYLITAAGTRFGLSMRQGDYLLCDQPNGRWKTVTADRLGERDCLWTRIEGEAADGIYRWDCILSAEHESGAETELLQKKRKKDLSAVSHGIRYGTDYELGDVVRVQMCAGTVRMAQNKRVCAVTVWYEHGNSGEQPEFSD